MTLQQVNLLTPELLPERTWLSARVMGVAAGLLVFALAGFSGLQSVKVGKLETVRSESAQRLSELNAVRGTQPPSQNTLQAELDYLQTDV